jgi:transcriptional regulator with XRE-family HTH domain
VARSGFFHQKIKKESWALPEPFEMMNALFSERLRRARLASGLSVTEAAVKVGTSSQLYGSWERGRYVPGREQRIQVARALGIEAIELFPETEMTTKETNALYTFRALPPAMQERLLSLLQGFKHMVNEARGIAGEETDD